MADEDLPTIEVGDDEVELMVLLVTTRGVHMQPFPALGAGDLADQVAVVRDISAGLRRAADQLEARAGLAEAVDDVEEAMRP